jgi:hypothetical protein
MEVLQKIFIVRNFYRTSTSISDLAMHMPSPNQPLRSKACTPLCLLPAGHGNPSQWTTCQAFLQLSREMTMFLWGLIGFLRWASSQPARRISQWRPLPISSLNECGYTSGYHRPSYHIETIGSSAHFGPASGHCWTPSSSNASPSTPKLMSKQRSSTE